MGSASTQSVLVKASFRIPTNLKLIYGATILKRVRIRAAATTAYRSCFPVWYSSGIALCELRAILVMARVELLTHHNCVCTSRDCRRLWNLRILGTSRAVTRRIIHADGLEGKSQKLVSAATNGHETLASVIASGTGLSMVAGVFLRNHPFRRNLGPATAASATAVKSKTQKKDSRI